MMLRLHRRRRGAPPRLEVFARRLHRWQTLHRELQECELTLVEFSSVDLSVLRLNSDDMAQRLVQHCVADIVSSTRRAIAPKGAEGISRSARVMSTSSPDARLVGMPMLAILSCSTTDEKVTSRAS